MKRISSPSVIAALLMGMASCAAWADDFGSPRLSPPADQVAMDDGIAPLPPQYVQADTSSPSDKAPSLPPAEAAPAAAASASAAAVPESAATPCPCPVEPAGPKPWHLPQPCVFQNLGINMGGWSQQGITLNSERPADGFNGPVTTNDFDRQFQLNQLWLYFVRPTKTDGCGFDVGGRIDMAYGTDWRFGQCTGLEPTFDSPNSFYGLVLPQFYVEVAINDLTVKMGHFATLTSYEVVPAPLNFFYSHTYLMGGYFDPLLVTGVQADYKLNDNWTLVSGFNRGWMQFEDTNEDLDLVGGVKWMSDDKRSTLSMVVDVGAQDPAGENTRTNMISVFTHKLSQRLQYATQVTVGYEPNGGFTPPGSDGTWYGMDHWLIYQINPKWSAGMRFEWLRDEHGARIAGVGNILGPGKGWDGAPGFAGNFTDLTFGLNWRPHPNLVFRPEIRWDWYQGSRNIAGELPFDDGTKSHQFLAGMDLIVTF